MRPDCWIGVVGLGRFFRGFPGSREAVPAHRRRRPLSSGVGRILKAENGFALPAAPVQDRLGVATGLGGPGKDEILGGLEGDAAVGIRRHRPVRGIVGVLLVDHGGHPTETGPHIVFGHHPVVQPVGQQLAGDPQGCAVLHQGDVVDVGHFRAANTGVDPAHHVAEDRLPVVVDLLVNLRRVQATSRWARGMVSSRSMVVRRLPASSRWTASHVDVVVVHGVKGGGGGRGHPRGGGAGAGLADLLGHHVGHQVGHRPHALADLGASGETGGQTDVDVLILVGQDPRLGLHPTLADHRSGLHRGVDFVAGAVQESGVDEHHPVGGRLDTRLEVQGGPALLVHDADFDGVGRQAEDVLDAAEQLAGERHLVRSVHLGLDDVDRPGAAVLPRPADRAGRSGW